MLLFISLTACSCSRGWPDETDTSARTLMPFSFDVPMAQSCSAHLAHSSLPHAPRALYGQASVAGRHPIPSIWYMHISFGELVGSESQSPSSSVPLARASMVCAEADWTSASSSRSLPGSALSVRQWIEVATMLLCLGATLSMDKKTDCHPLVPPSQSCTPSACPWPSVEFRPSGKFLLMNRLLPEAQALMRRPSPSSWAWRWSDGAESSTVGSVCWQSKV